MSNLLQKLDYIDYSDPDLLPKELAKDKDWKGITRKMYAVIEEMDPDMVSVCMDKINTVYDKYLHTESGEPNYEEAARILKSDMERDNGPTWICMIGTDFSFNIKSQKNACLFCYYGEFGFLLYKC